VSARPGLHGELLRFGLLGAANTIATGAGFYALSFLVPAAVAFTIVYVCGIALVSLATPGFVFGSTPTRARRAGLALVYAGVFVMGQAMIRLLQHLDAPRLGVVLGTLAVTAPLGFVVARLLVGR
jgi:putative flippase GtrA